MDKARNIPGNRTPGREPFPASRKIHIEGKMHDIRVAMRQIQLTGKSEGGNQRHAIVYDTSGPHTDDQIETDLNCGLPRLRESWVMGRGDVEETDDNPCWREKSANERREREKDFHSSFPAPVIRAKSGRRVTQMRYARQGIVTPEMEYVAIRENQQAHEAKAEGRRHSGSVWSADSPIAQITPEFVRDEIAQGHAVLPANINHPESEPMIIGSNFLTKINANIGTSAITSGTAEEVEKAVWACHWGADTITDLSTGKEIHATREWIIRSCPTPVGTSPIYQALEKVDGQAEELSWEIFRDTFIEQAQQGVDFMSVNAGVLLRYIPLTRQRLTGIVSRGGAIIAKWCMAHSRENFLYSHFDEICALANQYGVTLSLGNGLRPGSISDANDQAQFAELETVGELTERAWACDVPVMIEGPGHTPAQLIKESMDAHIALCHGAPTYCMGPLVTDAALGYDHIAAAMGAMLMGWHGASLLCCVTPKEHLGLPDMADIRQTVAAFRIAAHAADLAKGHPVAFLRDNLLSEARFAFHWQDQFNLSFDPHLARDMHEQNLPAEFSEHAHFCSMCGPNFCSMRANKQLRDAPLLCPKGQEADKPQAN